MATTTHVPVETYLTTVYEPDMDYVDGELEERNVGEYEHNLVQMAILLWFHTHGREWSIRAIQEQRTKLTPTRYRIPDVGIFRRSQPRESIFTVPYLIAIEVLSPDDRHTRMQARIDDFRAFGVKDVWVVDPIERVGWNCSTGNWIAQERFEVTGTPIYLSLTELFQKIDEDERD